MGVEKLLDIEKLINFSRQYYKYKDIMHDLSYIERMLKIAKELSEAYKEDIDIELIVYGCYFHGFIYKSENEIKEYLKEQGVSKEKILKIILVSWESQKDEEPNLLEGKIIHDAHLLEGGKTYIIVKSLITGALRGQNVDSTIKYIEDNILGKQRCYLPESQEQYLEKEQFAKDFIKDLKMGLEI